MNSQLCSGTSCDGNCSEQSSSLLCYCTPLYFVYLLFCLRVFDINSFKKVDLRLSRNLTIMGTAILLGALIPYHFENNRVNTGEAREVR